MGLLDNVKKKAETLATGAGKIADKTISNVGEWTTQTVQAVNDWTPKALKDVGGFAVDTWGNKEKYLNDLKAWTAEMPEKLKDYTDDFNVEDFWNKIAETGKSIGQNFIFMALTCFYALPDLFKVNANDTENSDTPSNDAKTRVKAKAQNRCAMNNNNSPIWWEITLILGALGYFILPTDVIPDFLGPIGFADDGAALAFAFKKATGLFSADNLESAHKKTQSIMGKDFDEEKIAKLLAEAHHKKK